MKSISITSGLLLSFVQLVFSIPALGAGVHPGQIKNLVTFGDSYTDIVSVGDGGVAWPVYAAGYAGVDLHPFARSGATCSNKITPRPFPSVFESQLPAFFNATGLSASGASGGPGHGNGNGTLVLKPEETVYTLWIGTNDLGAGALITGSDGDASLVDVTQCMIDWVKVLFGTGARNFIFQNMIPLETTILYSATSYPNRFWTGPRNTTEWSVFMKELTLSGNQLTKLMLQDVLKNLPGAHVALFDSHSLFSDMFAQPALYLNGTAPLNVTGCVNSCVFDANAPSAPPACTVAHGTDRDSFLWFDELHPSEQADRIVAREIALVVEGKESKWNTWLS